MSEILTIIGYIVFGLYNIALVAVLIYCTMQLHLLIKYIRKNRLEPNISETPLKEYPFVTIQLPLFNEQYVVERLIDNIMEIDYPKDRYEVHILDDSTDETIAISQRKVSEYAKQGFNIELITRDKREGYKAGALRDAMDDAQGEFIAIFDADFLPEPDFLKKTIPYFDDEKVGVVQTRWEHINEDYSLLTRLQAFQLNVHFTIEQMGRYVSDYLLQFNGTAGVWRKETIDSAGGWEADTLTEDLDLSYRAQLKGWKIIYREDVGSPAELPAEIHGLKSQQYRWMKGGAETAKKMLPVVWKSHLPLTKKLHATVHLLSSTVFVGAFLIGVLSVPLIFITGYLHIDNTYLQVFLLSLMAIIVVYYFANVEQEWMDQPKWKLILKFVLLFPLFLSISMGLSLHNSVAVIQGYLGKKSAFIRTPKFNIVSVKDSFKKEKYLNGKLSGVSIMEGILCIYFIAGIAMGIWKGEDAFMMLHVLLVLGYGMIFYYSVRHLRT